MSLSGGIKNHHSAASPVPVGALDQLAHCFRPGGLFLMMIASDGTVTYHDSGSNTFFLRYVLPLMQYKDPSGNQLREQVRTMTPATPLTVFTDLPGVSLAIFPHSDRRQMQGIFVLAARGNAFSLSEDILRVCSKLGVDATWLSHQAEQLPAYGSEAIALQTRLLANMVRDQLRVSLLEKELDSLSSQLSNTYEELSLIYQLSSGMKINRRPSEFFKQCCLNVMDVMGTRGMGVALAGESFRQHEPVVYGDISLPPGKIHRLADDLMVELRQRKAALLCNDLHTDKRFGWVSEFAARMLAVPLMREEQVLGCLFAFDKASDEFDTVDSKLLTSIGNESAIYLENAMLFDDARGLMMGLLRSLTSAVDAKDTYTCGHSERVALLSRYVAQQAGLSEHLVERVYMAGLLHDVGKIGVPEVVLQKAGRLDPEEFEQIKKHPEIGARILRDVKQIQDIIPGVLHHHERYDGKGYPAGLVGENISLMGRIICLADCFDAMTTSRTYRKALPLEVALAEIRRCGGTQFDPALAEAFMNISPETLGELLRDHRQQVLRYSDTAQLRVA